MDRMSDTLKLAQDVFTALENWERDDTPFWRRTCYRVCFSYIDAELYQMKMDSVSVEMPEAGGFTRAETALIHEENYEIDEKGKARVRPYFGHFKNRLRFSFGILAKANDIEYTPDYSDNRWNSLSAADKVRNRITHPKKLEDMNISLNEMRNLSDGFRWFIGTYKAIQVEILEDKKKIIAEKKRALEALNNSSAEA